MNRYNVEREQARAIVERLEEIDEVEDPKSIQTGDPESKTPRRYVSFKFEIAGVEGCGEIHDVDDLDEFLESIGRQ